MGNVVFNITEIGYMHTKSQTVCQDYSLSFIDDDVVILAVCDGHGGDDYFRSDKGSYFACVALEKVFKKYASEISLESIDDRFKEKLKLDIIMEWNKMVEEDVKRSDFTKEELNRFDDARKARLIKDFYRAYGTTLNGALIANGFVVAVNLGDGSITVVNKNMDEYRPIDVFPDDNEDEVANTTNSMCQEDVFSKMNVMCIREVDVELIALCTDGVINPYGDFENYVKNVPMNFYQAIRIKYGTVDDCKKFIQKLGAEKGNGDDVSFAVWMKEVL